jgi:hypothetical protein
LATANQLFLDGNELVVKMVPLVDDRREHFVELKVWSPVSAPENRSVHLKNANGPVSRQPVSAAGQCQ